MFIHLDLEILSGRHGGGFTTIYAISD